MSTDIIEIPAEFLPEIDELPGDLSVVARLIEERLPGQGVRLTLLLAEVLRGPVYFHSIEPLRRTWRNRAIRAAYDDGVKVLELANTYRLSVRQIWSILNEPQSQDETAEKQLNLF